MNTCICCLETEYYVHVRVFDQTYHHHPLIICVTSKKKKKGPTQYRSAPLQKLNELNKLMQLRAVSNLAIYARSAWFTTEAVGCVYALALLLSTLVPCMNSSHSPQHHPSWLYICCVSQV